MAKLVARVEILIRKSPKVVFDAFVKPRTLEKFWLNKTSGPLAPNATVQWDFMVKAAHETVKVTQFEKDKLIAFKWSDGVSVRMHFSEHEKDATILSIEAKGFQGAGSPAKVVAATEGFTLVACDLKSLLESGKSGHFVRDKAVLITAIKTTA